MSLTRGPEYEGFTPSQCSIANTVVVLRSIPRALMRFLTLAVLGLNRLDPSRVGRAAFPLRVEAQSASECIYGLRAGMGEAAVTPSSEPGKNYDLVIVHRITPKGRDELERMRRGEPAS